MERTKDYPWGRCSMCGYSGSSLSSDHAYSGHDQLCSMCLSRLDELNPWVVHKLERTTGDVHAAYRHRTEASAALTLKRLEANPDASEDGRFGFVMFKEQKDPNIPF